MSKTKERAQARSYLLRNYSWQEFQYVVQTSVYEDIATDEELAEIEENIRQIQNFLKTSL